MSDVRQEEGMTQFLVLVRQHLKAVDANESLAMDAPLEGLGLDSQAALTLMLDLEETFGVVFPDTMFTEETFATAGSLWKALSLLRKR